MTTVVRDTNEVRDRVVRALADYVELSASMRELEDAFSARVMHTARQLQEIVATRTRLEAEYRRIRDRVERGGYGSDEELADDVESVLTDEPDAYQVQPAEAPAEIEADDLDAATKERIVREFKRIVLPKVHSDTSETPYAIFEVAYSAYRSRDYTLMAAFVVQYRGEVTATGDDGRPLTPDQLATRLSDYRAAEHRLADRVTALRASLTEDEVRDPVGTRERMARQQEQFHRAIAREADRLRELRERLEALARRGAG
ncbi:hypothetical protein [Actinophytocola oryzae]|uniref:Uncharacterized protein n=1 Tax=Actinophytocola oryzae TaxID=502181 RepID=A0A4R7V5Y0_9PSEU|nr:hypothetical protein [Actinophytocola oryzae]TDV44829.1 hypothetical protein CLV71_11388 [Actinophytocola oryzae]